MTFAERLHSVAASCVLSPLPTVQACTASCSLPMRSRATGVWPLVYNYKVVSNRLQAVWSHLCRLCMPCTAPRMLPCCLVATAHQGTQTCTSRNTATAAAAAAAAAHMENRFRRPRTSGYTNLHDVQNSRIRSSSSSTDDVLPLRRQRCWLHFISLNTAALQAHLVGVTQLLSIPSETAGAAAAAAA
jgi:hypothetical protein